MSLTAGLNLNQDIMQHIAHFLPVKDFYNLKQVVPTINDGDYWWDKPITLATAVSKECSTLVKWILDSSDLQPIDITSVVHLTNNAFVHKELYYKFLDLWPKNISLLIDAFVSHGCNNIFKYIISRNTKCVTQDTCDSVYLHERWIMMACIFVKSPKQFIEYVFGSYKNAADPEVILNLRFVLLYLYPSERILLSNILIKYHEWLWNKMLHKENTLDSIVAIHKLEVFKFNPNKYVKLALESKYSIYIEYLVLQNLVIEPWMMSMTRDVDKLRIIYSAQTTQKYQKLMLLLIILIALVFGNLFFRDSKIESNLLINKDEYSAIQKPKKILHPEENPGWRFGVSSNA